MVVVGLCNSALVRTAFGKRLIPTLPDLRKSSALMMDFVTTSGKIGGVQGRCVSSYCLEQGEM